jgi:hypothetical protein
MNVLLRWCGVVALVVGSGLVVAAPAHAALPGQSLGSDRLVATQEMVAWSTDAIGFGRPGAVNSQFIMSQNGASQFFAQADGNLVIYSGTHATWALNLYRQGPGFIDSRQCVDTFFLEASRFQPVRQAFAKVFLVAQTDGNLVLHQGLKAFSQRGGQLLGTGRCPMWHSRTAWFIAASPQLVMQNDGNLVLIVNGTPIWWVSKPDSGFIQVG